jgi:hypothetical protein
VTVIARSDGRGAQARRASGADRATWQSPATHASTRILLTGSNVQCCRLMYNELKRGRRLPRRDYMLR